MPLRESAPLGAPCWVDLFTSDPDRSLDFYGRLFGWTAESGGEEYGGYINFSKDGHLVAGAMTNDGTSNTPDVWSVYLATDDAKATVDAAVDKGGQVIVPAMQVSELGTMAVLSDVGQASIGLWQRGLHKGFGIVGEPGTPNWFELYTREYDAAIPFYQDVFNWKTSTMSATSDFRYTTLGEGDSALAGIMDGKGVLPEGVPSHWEIYFGVEDTDAALAQITKMGGSVLMGAADSPFGRLAQASDPTGAIFKLVATS